MQASTPAGLRSDEAGEGARLDPGIQPGPRPAGVAAALWLHLQFPQLPLEVLIRGNAAQRACVLTTGEGGRRRVVLTNARAAALGIRPGFTVGAALALGEVTVLARNQRAEQRALEQLCLWAMQFSSRVSAVPPDGVVLEIKGSLKLFAGVQGLSRRLRQGLKQLGYRGQYAIAPTPLAAAVLARSGGHMSVLEPGALNRHLSDLPITVLRLDPAQQAALESIGVTSIGDCRRLSRSGLARRFSPQLVDVLDRLYGAAADPRTPVAMPASFDAILELPWEVHHAPALITAGERLLHELIGYLRAHAACTRRLCWQLVDRDRRCERFEIRLTQAGRDHAHMLLLLREQLMRMRLKAPVTSLALRVDDLILAPASLPADLFATRPQEQVEAYASFIDRLRAHCGDEALRSIGEVSDHRPEHAWRWRQLDEPGPGTTAGAGRAGRATSRPLWLVRRPLTLQTRDGQPQFDGPLWLTAERERIDTGWWEGPARGRDYFIATTSHGSRLWIYKELEGERRWRLHGVFE